MLFEMDLENLDQLPHGVGMAWGLQRLKQHYPLEDKLPDNNVNKSRFIAKWLSESTAEELSENEGIPRNEAEATTSLSAMGLNIYPEGWKKMGGISITSSSKKAPFRPMPSALNSPDTETTKHEEEKETSVVQIPRSRVVKQDFHVVSQVKKHSNTIDKICTLVHGLNVPRLPKDLHSSNLNVAVQNALSNVEKMIPTEVESYGWQGILRGDNVCLIHEQRPGKITTIVAPLCSLMLEADGLYKQLPDSKNSPLTIVLTNNDSISSKFFTKFHKILQETAMKNSVWSAHLPLNQDEISERFEKHFYPTEVLITTADTLIELLNLEVISLSRLCHFVVDNIDIIATLYAQQFQDILRLIDEVVSNRLHYNEVQFISTSQMWVPELEQLVGTLEKFPLLIFGNAKQAAIYAKAEFHLEYLQSHLKPEKLAKTLKECDCTNHRCIVFCNMDDLPLIKQCLSLAGICFDTIHEELPNCKIHDVHSSWNSSLNGNHFVLLATDQTLRLLHDGSLATLLINYSFPSELRKFTLRLTTMLINYESPFTPVSNSQTSSRRIFTFVDEKTLALYPAQSKFFDQTGIEIPPQLQNACKAFIAQKEMAKIANNVPLCAKFKNSGSCTFFSCHFRHAFSRQLDVPALPFKQSGRVRGKLIEYLAPNHFLVKFEEYYRANGSTEHLKNNANLVCAALRSCADFETAELLEKGQVALYHHDQETFRCVIYNINSVNVKILGVDNASKRSSVLPEMLFKLPQRLRSLPQSIFEVIIPNVKPPFKESVWNANTKSRVYQQFSRFNWRICECEIDVVLQNQHTIWAKDLHFINEQMNPSHLFSLVTFLRQKMLMDYNEENIETLKKAWY